jgi:hypothetical protein
MHISHRHSVLWTLLLMLALGAGAAFAATPQTIVIDGVNDFLPVNEADADTADTQYPNIDLGRVFITNDAVNLYIGAEFDQGGWGTVQIGMAIDVGTPDGGATDPWGRAIEWSTAANKPDHMFYINLDSNWQDHRVWNGASWVSATAGVNALGWTTGTGFRELSILLGDLGVGPGDTVNIEMWITQDGATKGPLDLLYADGLQLSIPGFTLWDTASPIPLSEYLPYTVQAAADPDPPYVLRVDPTAHPITDQVDVVFNEPVAPASVTDPAGQFALTGATVSAAAVNGARVTLTLDAPLAASAALYQVTVTGVTDVAGNPITTDGVDNTACFGLKNVVFRGKFGPFLANQGEGPHAFSVEGSKGPLTFDPLCDTAIMADTGVDDVWEAEVLMLYGGDCAAGTATESFEWKFNYNCGTWESLAGNRVHELDLANGAEDILEFWWNDDDPTTFTQRDVTVVFQVDMSASAPAPTDTVGLNGSLAPLNFNVPSETVLADDGLGDDAAAGDGVYTATVTFPAGSYKDLSYKFLLGGVYECSDQGDRYVFINDEVYGDGVNGGDPLVLPVVLHDWCSLTPVPVEVVFSVDFNNTAWENIGAGDVVSLNGTETSNGSIAWNVPSSTVMLDDGVAPDLVAGDKIYTVAVVYPDSSQQNNEYKYLVNDEYECSTQGNRSFGIDFQNHDAAGDPQILPTDKFQVCGAVSVPEARGAALALDQNRPNPFNPSTEISFSVQRPGAGSLRVFNVRGELVRTLLEGRIAAGEQTAVWDGRNDDGGVASSGVYFYRLEVAGEAQTRRMVLLK